MSVAMQPKRERIPQYVIKALLEKVSLLDLVKESMPVSRAGDFYRSHCPFHMSAENDPTLIIDTTNNTFECSSCQFNGSSIGWLMYNDGLSMPESIQELGRRSNYDVSEWVSNDAIAESLHTKTTLLEKVSQFYCDTLNDSPEYLAYLKERSIDAETLTRFGVGCAPADLSDFDSQFDKSMRQLWNCGVLIRRSNKEFGPRFRNRLMFPIKSENGQVLGFGGRSISGNMPKYLNSPSSNLFNKSETIYGLYEALQRTDGSSPFILVEGYIDVLMLSQHGYQGAVATMGTSPSEHHVKTLFGHSDNVVGCFDGDDAGIKAAMRLVTNALPVVEEFQHLSIVLLPAGYDPDSYLREHGPLGFAPVLDQAIPAEDFLFDQLSSSLDIDSIGGKAALSEAALPYLKSIRSTELRESFIRKIENVLGFTWGV